MGSKELLISLRFKILAFELYERYLTMQPLKVFMDI